mmetsp:Transcript_31319/g.31797  ORF Transcript_31319/g.31797 Transcript_31319/m.31797 type:complete len:96 (+) Transcript_31319:545-832(+)
MSGGGGGIHTAYNCVDMGGGGGGGVSDSVYIVRELTIPSDVKRRELGIFRIYYCSSGDCPHKTDSRSPSGLCPSCIVCHAELVKGACDGVAHAGG